MATNLEIAVRSNAAVAGLRKYDSATDRSTTKTKKFGRSVGRLDNQLVRTGTTASTVGRLFGGLFAGFTAIAVIRSATQAMASFEETMAVVRGVTGSSIEEFKRLENVAKELGSTTRFSATQAGEGLLFLARAGFTTNEAIAAIPATLKFAQSSMLDLGTAADIVSNVLTQFGLSAEETAKAGNILVNTANSANTNVMQLAEAMKFVGPIAGSLGISLEETAASIGVLGDSGIQASMAGTSLRMALLKLIKPTSEAKEAISDLGLTVEDLNPTTNTLADIFLKLRKANLGAVDSLKIFGVRSAASILQLSRNADRVKELTKANKENMIVLDKMSALMDDTLRGAFLSLKSAIEATFLAVGDQGLTGGLKNLTQTAADSIRILLGMEEQLKGDTAAAEKLAFAIEAVGTALASLAVVGSINLLIKLGSAFTASAVASTFMAKRVFIVNTAMKTTVISAGLLGRVMRTLSLIMRPHPILLIAGALTAVVLAFRHFNSSTEETISKTVDLNEVFGNSTDKILGMAKAQEEYRKSLGNESIESRIKALEKMNALIDITNETVKLRSEFGSKINITGETKKFLDLFSEKEKLLPALITSSTITPRKTLIGTRPEDITIRKNLVISAEEIANAKENELVREKNLLEIGKLRSEQDQKRIKKLDDDAKRAIKARTRLDDLLEGLKFERTLIGKTNEEREVAVTLEKAKNIATKGGIELSKERALQLKETIIDLNRAEKLVDIGNRVGESFSHAFLDMATGAASARESIRLLIQEIARLVLKRVVADPLSQVISSFATNVAGSLFAGSGTVSAADSTNASIGGQSGFSLIDSNRAIGTPKFILNIDNKSSIPIISSNVSTEIEGRSFVTNIIVDDLNHGGVISTAIGAR